MDDQRHTGEEADTPGRKLENWREPAARNPNYQQEGSAAESAEDEAEDRFEQLKTVVLIICFEWKDARNWHLL